MKKFLVVFAVMYMSLGAHARHIPDAAAVKAFERALQCYAKNQPEKAFAYMERASRIDPAWESPYETLGEWYLFSHRYTDAAEVFARGSEACGTRGVRFRRMQAVSLLRSQDPAAALALCGRYGTDSEDWKAVCRQAGFVQRSVDVPLPVRVENAGLRLNTPFAELFPVVSASGDRLFYTRRTNGIDEDIYVSEADSCGGWLSGVPLPYPLNTSAHEGGQMLSADGRYLFFMRCGIRSANGWDGGGCDLFMSYFQQGSWSSPRSFGGTINTPAYEGMPFLSPDNRDLYFVSNRPGGYGGMDIWVSRFEGGLWQEPVNAGPSVNTPGNETAPFLCADNRTLIFASDGHPGMGGSDILISRRTDEESGWEAALNPGYPLNTTYDEASLSLSADGKQAFLSSNRNRLQGDFDIYEMEWPASLRPLPVQLVYGRVYDSLETLPLPYAVILIHDLGGRECYRYTSNRGDGSFVLTLPSGAPHLISVHRIGYQDILRDTVRFSTEDTLPAVYNAALLPEGYQRPLTDTLLATVLFRTNMLSLSDSVIAALRESLLPWAGRTDVLISVHGYTDNSGTPMINEEYSWARARLISGLIREMGFSADLVSESGWGEANPVADNDTPEGRDRNRRVEIVISQ